jgi:hypothetical protein
MELALRSAVVIDFVSWMKACAVLATCVTGQNLHTNFVTLRNPEIIPVHLRYLLLTQLRCLRSYTHEYTSFARTKKM